MRVNSENATAIKDIAVVGEAADDPCFTDLVVQFQQSPRSPPRVEQSLRRRRGLNDSRWMATLFVL